MNIVPAVDIRGGKCVNLVQGDYSRETIFSEDPIGQAEQWWQAMDGKGIVHIVDLDGAREGRCCILPELRALNAAGIRYEVGGGLRDIDSIASVIDAGAERAILGTIAYRDPELLRNACAEWTGKIAVGIDARDGKVALSGWEEVTDTDALGFAKDMEDAGAVRIIYTDILSDGMLKGPNIEATAALASEVSIPVTLSGGISSIDDLKRAKMIEGEGVDEIIIGRALYVQNFTVKEALAAVQ